MKKFTLFSEDLDYIFKNTSKSFLQFKNAHIFITGAKGFFGIWLIESILFANKELNLNVTIYALTRSEQDFYLAYPHLKQFPQLKIIEGTVLAYPQNFQNVDYIIHAANLPYYVSPSWATEHIHYGILGTHNVFETAKKYNIRSLLVTSSGAVYRNAYSPLHADIHEQDLFLTTQEASVYAETKRTIEQLTQDFYAQTKIPCCIARCFALAGAYLPLDKFALGNFIQNALDKKDISIMGTGKAKRSYMYGVDLIIWLITILTETKDLQMYNVGSDKAITIKELATLVANKHGLCMNIQGNEDIGNAPNDYIPNTNKVRDKLGLDVSFPLEEIIEKMYRWYKSDKI